MKSLTRPRNSRAALPQNALHALAAWGLLDLVSRAKAVQQMAPVPQWITIREASAYSGLSIALLRRLVTTKKLPSLKDGAVKVRRNDLDNLANVGEMAECTKNLTKLSAELTLVRFPHSGKSTGEV